MKKKLIIGIIGIPSHDSEDKKITLMFDSYKNAIIKNNCIPFLIPSLLDIDYASTKLSEISPLSDNEKDTYKQMVDMCDGLIIPGGSRMYNFFDYITRYALEKDIPILGICMGMQLLANIDNNSNVLVKNETCINHRQVDINYAHKVKIIKNTILEDILKTDIISVNSRHLYNVSKVNSYKISAISEDGLIEGIESINNKFVIGIQWHPEKMINYDINSNKIFERFIEECKK